MLKWKQIKEIMRLSDRSKPFFLFGICVAIRLALIPLFNFCFDDAYINYRIARNLAQGYGLVFNPGEHILATTTLLYTLLLTPAHWLGIAFPTWSKLLNSFAMAFNIVLIYLLLKGRIREGLIWFICLFLGFNYVVISQDLLGMEASFVVLCILLATYCYQNNSGWITGLVLGATFLVRPEGMSAAFLFWLSVLLFKRSNFWKVSIPLAIIIVAWIFYSLVFFGTLIPNTYQAKLAFFSKNPVPFTSHLSSIGIYLFAYIAFAPILILMLPFGIWRIVRWERVFLPLAIWTVITLLTQLFSSFYLAPWYLAMVMPFIFLICIIGLEQLFAVVLPSLGRKLKSIGLIVAIVLLSIANEVLIFMLAKESIIDLENLDALAGDIGTWLKAEKIHRDKVLAIEAIGRVGYESDIKILDVYGLASPEMIPYISINDISCESIIKHFHPDYIQGGDSELVNRVQGYKIARMFTFRTKLRGKNVPIATYIFQKEG